MTARGGGRVRRHSDGLRARRPMRATSSVLILSTSMPRARLVIDGSSSSSGGGSPLMKRSGLVRATTKLRRYGLLNPRAFSAATAAVTASS